MLETSKRTKEFWTILGINEIGNKKVSHTIKQKDQQPQ